MSTELLERTEVLELSLEDLVEAAVEETARLNPSQEIVETKTYANYGVRSRLSSEQEKKYQAVLDATLDLMARLGNGELQKCESCGEIYPAEAGYWPFCSPGLKGGHGRVRARNAQTSAPTAFYFNPLTKKIWIPGRNNRKPPRGYVKEEVSYSQRKGFYKLLDDQAKAVYFKRLEREEKVFGAVFSESRKQLRIDCKNKGWIEHAIEKTEKAAHAKHKYEPNSMVECWEYDNASMNDLEGTTYKKMLETLNDRQPENFKPKDVKRAPMRDDSPSKRKKKRK